ncbi:hypothetical protein [Clostridium butyricum]|uniref:hypothetical protein n=1 Tax=Clostridium butyricum TaxID=1492 RepID=UPI003D332218
MTLLMYLIASNGVQAIVDDDSINNSQEQTEKVINEILSIIMKMSLLRIKRVLFITVMKIMYY